MRIASSTDGQLGTPAVLGSVESGQHHGVGGRGADHVGQIAPVVLGNVTGASGREREDRVAVERGVHRADRAGEAVVRQIGNLDELVFVELGVGGDDADGRVGRSRDALSSPNPSVDRAVAASNPPPWRTAGR